MFFKSNIASIFNEIFSATSLAADFFWKHKIRTLIFLKYGERASPLSDEESSSSMDLRTILEYGNVRGESYIYNLLFVAFNIGLLDSSRRRCFCGRFRLRFGDSD